jgi:hypothetical protein
MGHLVRKLMGEFSHAGFFSSPTVTYLSLDLADVYLPREDRRRVYRKARALQDMASDAVALEGSLAASASSPRRRLKEYGTAATAYPWKGGDCRNQHRWDAVATAVLVAGLGVFLPVARRWEVSAWARVGRS